MQHFFRRAAIWIVTAALLLGGLQAPAHAQTSIIRVAYADYGSYLSMDEDGQMYGYCADYLKLVAHTAGWTLEYVQMEWDEALEKLSRGEIDLVCSATFSQERADSYSFSVFPACTEQYLLLTQPEADLYYDDFAALDGSRIATLGGTLTVDYLNQYADEHNITLHTQAYADTDSMFAALRGGEVAAVAVTNLTPHNNLRPIAQFAATPAYFMSGPDSLVMKQLNEAVATLKAEDPVFDARLQETYFGRSFTTLPPLTRQEAAYIAAHPVVTVGIYAGRGPFYIQDGEDGLYVEVLRLLSETAGIEFRPVVMTGAVSDVLASGSCDLLIDVTCGSWPASSTGFRRTDSFFDVQTALLGRRSAATDLNGPIKMGITQQFASAAAHLQGVYPNAKIRYYPDTDACLDAVLRGEVDVMADSSYLLGYQLQNPRYSSLSIQTMDYLDDQACFLSPAQTPGELLDLVNKCLTQIGRAEITRLTTYYTNLNNDEVTFLDLLHPFRYSLWLIGGLGAACLALVLIVWRSRARNRRIAGERRLAQLSSQAKSDFLSRMSHELRTPMNAIVGLAGLTLETTALPQQVRENITQIDTSSQYLLALLNDILDMSRIENAKMQLAEEIVSYESFRTTVFTIIAPQAERKGVRFLCTHNRPDYPYIYADKMRLTQIFVNLLNNAIKFTPPGGQVELIIDILDHDKTYVHKRFTVRDNGAGMSPAFVERMFQPFEQERVEYGATGTGLGLAIVKNLVELMGGDIRVSSEPGKGTQFVVELRFRIAPPPHPTDTVGPESAPPSILAGRRVLLVEDHPINQMVARKLLETCGAAVDTAANGKEALAQFLCAGASRYDCIFMDVQMPEMNGFECTQAIRASSHPRARTIPIIAMTANVFDSDVNMCLQAGMNAHIGKPITATAIEASLRSIEL